MSDCILATYSHTCAQSSSLTAQVRKRNLGSITHLIQQTHWELIPLGASILGIYLARLNNYGILTTSRWNNSSVHSFSFQLYWTVSLNTYIDIVHISSSKDAVVHQLIYTCMCRHWYQQWHSHLSWAICRYHSSHPNNRVCVVGEGKVDMITCLLHILDIHIVPNSLTCLYFCACGPVETYQILAQAWVSNAIGYIQTEVNWLVGNNLQIYILSIYLVVGFLEASELLNQVAQDVWSQSAQLKASRDRQCHLCTCGILAVGYKAQCHMSTTVAFVCQIET